MGTVKKDKWWWIYIAVVIAICTLSVVSCTTTKYVPVEHTVYNTHTEYQQVHDSIQIHDSVMIEKRGDTVFQDRWHTIYRDRWQDRIIGDTVRDTIQVPVTVLAKADSKSLLSSIDLILIGVIAALLVSLLLFRKYSK